MNNEIQSKAKKLIDVRNAIKEMDEQMDKLKEKRQELQTDLIFELKKNKLNSIKTADNVMISKQVQRTLTITDEPALVRWFKKEKLVDYIQESVKRDLWRPFSNQALKEGLKVGGTELKETEFISIRQ